MLSISSLKLSSTKDLCNMLKVKLLFGRLNDEYNMILLDNFYILEEKIMINICKLKKYILLMFHANEDFVSLWD